MAYPIFEYEYRVPIVLIAHMRQGETGSPPISPPVLQKLRVVRLAAQPARCVASCVRGMSAPLETAPDLADRREFLHRIGELRFALFDELQQHHASELFVMEPMR
jgi:hypothetical protein